jgi:hypothetical protein
MTKVAPKSLRRHAIEDKKWQASLEALFEYIEHSEHHHYTECSRSERRDHVYRHAMVAEHGLVARGLFAPAFRLRP